MLLPVVTATQFCSILHDVIIVGGGTAGLALAARLSENPKLMIGVIEAGNAQFDNNIVNIPGMLGEAVYSELDWNFTTNPQAQLHNEEILISRGKMLGGTSGSNYFLWNRAGSQDYDDWVTLGNTGWGWSDIFKSSEISERYQAPAYQSQLGILSTPPVNPALHNTSGVVYNSFPKWGPDAQSSFLPTLNNLGIPTNPETMGGNNLGVFVSLQSIEQTNATRAYSANTYLAPALSRNNLQILTGAQVTQVLMMGTRATGVQYVAGSATHEAYIKKEVVLSAGPIMSPAILEHSGIGNSSILKRAGVNSTVNLPGVGENFQDHIYACNAYEFVPGVTTIDALRNATLLKQFAAEYNASKTGPFTGGFGVFAMIALSQFLPPAEVNSLVQLAQSTPETSVLAPLLKKHISNNTIPDVEILFATALLGGQPAPGRGYLSLGAGLLHPFSVGSVHISSSNPLAYPTIAANFYNDQTDREIMLQAIQFVDNITQTEPLKSYIAQRVSPPPGTLSSSEWWDHLVDNSGTLFDPVGTCAMLPQASGGVVDTHLRVYGVTGLRVVDSSIIPKQIGTHLQATVYAIAEKAAAIMKQDIAAYGY